MLEVEIRNNIPSNFANLITDKYKLFANNEFYRLYFDYVPADTLSLARNVNITKDGIRHKESYGYAIYNGNDMNFQEDIHPLASAEWDLVAYKSHKKVYLNTLQNALGRVV